MHYVPTASHTSDILRTPTVFQYFPQTFHKLFTVFTISNYNLSVHLQNLPAWHTIQESTHHMLNNDIFQKTAQ